MPAPRHGHKTTLSGPAPKLKNAPQERAHVSSRSESDLPCVHPSTTAVPVTDVFPLPVEGVRADEYKPLTDDQETKYREVLAYFRATDMYPTRLHTASSSGSEAAGPAKAPLTDSEKMRLLTREGILRYLRATKWDVEEARKRLEATIAWRREFKVDELDPAVLESEAVSGKEIVLGYDVHGRPLHYMYPHRNTTPDSLIQMQYAVWLLEVAIDLMPPGVEQLALLINFENKSRNPTSIANAKLMLYILQNHYVERLGIALCINVPWIFKVFYNAIQPFIDPATKAKARFENIAGQVPKPQLEENFGGVLDSNYNHKVYWPALLARVTQRRAEMMEVFLTECGGDIGVSEWIIRGGQNRWPGAAPAQPPGVPSSPTPETDEDAKAAVSIVADPDIDAGKAPPFAKELSQTAAAQAQIHRAASTSTSKAKTKANPGPPRSNAQCESSTTTPALTVRGSRETMGAAEGDHRFSNETGRTSPEPEPEPEPETGTDDGTRGAGGKHETEHSHSMSEMEPGSAGAPLERFVSALADPEDVKDDEAGHAVPAPGPMGSAPSAPESKASDALRTESTASPCSGKARKHGGLEAVLRAHQAHRAHLKAEWNGCLLHEQGEAIRESLRDVRAHWRHQMKHHSTSDTEAGADAGSGAGAESDAASTTSSRRSMRHHRLHAMLAPHRSRSLDRSSRPPSPGRGAVESCSPTHMQGPGLNAARSTESVPIMKLGRKDGSIFQADEEASLASMPPRLGAKEGAQRSTEETRETGEAVTVLYFASVKEAAGRAVERVALSSSPRADRAGSHGQLQGTESEVPGTAATRITTLAQLVGWIGDKHRGRPDMLQVLQHARWAINEQLVDPEAMSSTRLSGGDTIAAMPPISG